jgi:aldose 1-epimerase
VTAVTGAQYEITAGGYAGVVTELGAGLRELRHHGHPVIAGYPADEMPPGAAGQLLAPWPNRVDSGRYTMGGISYQLDLTEPSSGSAIHGLTRWASWAAVRHDPGEVTLRTALLGHPGYPFCLELEARYGVSAERGLRVSVTARNTGSRPAPYGTGSHPYLTVGAATVDECELSLPATHWLPADERGIPSGLTREVSGTGFDFRDRRPIGTTRIDHAFTGLCRDEAGRAWARLTAGQAGLALWAGPGYRWLQVFTGDTLDPGRRRRALAVEPMTCPPNAFASGTDVLTLKPGETVTHTWGIQAWQPPPAAGQ